jgi:hypothetical protein
MDAEEIITKANAEGGPPEGWTVFHLLRGKVIWGIVGWILGVVIGFLLLYAVVPVVIPYNFERGVFAIIVSVVLLAILAFIFVGSLIMLVTDIRRLLHAEQHVIVLTLTDFVKREGSKLVQVPLLNVLHVTARGRPPVERQPPEKESQVMGAGENMMGYLFGRYSTSSGMKQRRKRMRTPSSLAFIDNRTNKEVVVLNDTAYGDPFLISAVIKQYVTAAHTAKNADVASDAEKIAD